ncbi:MAG: hypothetical protein IPK32_11170 [Verrucomicrobiaceae bacterium]|nr:hypothetical protein [Verrucomicrobiaceae bacterium]
MDIKALIIQLIIGAIGGNGIGAVLKNLSLGPIGNTVAGLLGGAGGVQLLGMISPELAQGLGGQVGGAAAGGGVLMAIIGIIKSVMAGKK